MIGYHYTSYQNWLDIKQNGLKMTPIHKDELAEWFDLPIDGVWVWENELSPVDELGSVLWQLQSKTRTKIVKLAVEYHAGQELRYHKPGTMDSMKVSVYHTGTMGDYQFHPGNPVARILVEDIPAKDIKCVKVFELLDVVKETK